ncbi:MAG: UDP-N-acetylmuramoyl-L-alanyl-D-glutamate--2,6-diaminopimelate ligase, partial [Acidobacteriota bacterium]
LHRILAGIKDAGARAAAMEVSSHALELGRVEDVLFDVAAFTNLSRDHLDFHGDMESYFQAKCRLFDQLKPGGTAVVHLEAEAGAGDWGRRLAAGLAERGVSLVTCGVGDGLPSDGPGLEFDIPHISPAELQLDLGGISARLMTPAGELSLRSPLLGRFHLLNLITAAACGVALGLELAVIERGLADVRVVPGRLERVDGPIEAFVDYAHTPAALEAALTSMRELSTRPLVVVFGCGGERDRGKRPEMGRAAGSLADVAVLTSDNPRREDPARILADAEAGLLESDAADYVLEPDRRRAIELSVERARALGGVIVVAGKGHEASQDLGERTIEFDDRDELRRAMALPGSVTGAAGPADPGRVDLGVSHG